MIHVCMVVESIYQTGGMENQALLLARNLSYLDVEVVFISSFPWRACLQGGFTRKQEGLQVLNIPEVARLPQIYRVIFNIGLRFYLMRIQNKIDILHIHKLSSAALSAVNLAAWMNKPNIIKIASGGYVGDLAKLRENANLAAQAHSLKLVDRFVSISSEISMELEEAGIPENRIVSIPNGVDIDLYRPISSTEKLTIREQLSLSSTAPTVVYVGRFTHKKRVGTLLRAWQHVHREKPEARLILLGNGKDNEKMRALAHDLGILSQVSFVGQVHNVCSYLQSSDLFVLPSISEGLPNALLEAMAVGLPCITSDTIGNRDLIQHGVNGLMFQVDDSQQLAETIVRAISDVKWAAQLGCHARETVKTKYSIVRIAEEYVCLYKELISLQK